MTNSNQGAEARQRKERAMDKIDVLAALRNVENIPQHGKLPRHRAIYETVNGNFSIDYAAFPGGTTSDVPLSVIRELEADGVIVLKHPDNPQVKMWILAEVIR